MKEPGKCGETIAVVYELTKRTQEKQSWLKNLIYNQFHLKKTIQVKALFTLFLSIKKETISIEKNSFQKKIQNKKKLQ